MIKKYIELEQLTKIINDIYSATEDANLTKILQEIENVPATNIIENRHGTWKDKNNGRWIFCPMCSECQESFYEMPVNLKGKVIHNYCPNCGARMDLDEVEE